MATTRKRITPLQRAQDRVALWERVTQLLAERPAELAKDISEGGKDIPDEGYGRIRSRADLRETYVTSCGHGVRLFVAWGNYDGLFKKRRVSFHYCLGGPFGNDG